MLILTIVNILCTTNSALTQHICITALTETKLLFFSVYLFFYARCRAVYSFPRVQSFTSLVSKYGCALSARSCADLRPAALWLTDTDVSLFQLTPSNLSAVTLHQAPRNLNELFASHFTSTEFAVRHLTSVRHGTRPSWPRKFTVLRRSWKTFLAAFLLDLLSVNGFWVEEGSVADSRCHTNRGVKTCDTSYAAHLTWLVNVDTSVVRPLRLFLIWRVWHFTAAEYPWRWKVTITFGAMQQTVPPPTSRWSCRIQFQRHWLGLFLDLVSLCCDLGGH